MMVSTAIISFTMLFKDSRKSLVLYISTYGVQILCLIKRTLFVLNVYSPFPANEVKTDSRWVGKCLSFHWKLIPGQKCKNIFVLFFKSTTLLINFWFLAFIFHSPIFFFFFLEGGSFCDNTVYFHILSIRLLISIQDPKRAYMFSCPNENTFLKEQYNMA